MGDDEAMADFVAPALGVGPAPSSAAAAGEGSAVVLGAAMEVGATEETGADGLVVSEGDCATAGDKLEAARTADAATAHRKPVILRMLNPPGTVMDRGTPRQGCVFIISGPSIATDSSVQMTYAEPAICSPMRTSSGHSPGNEGRVTVACRRCVCERGLGGPHPWPQHLIKQRGFSHDNADTHHALT